MAHPDFSSHADPALPSERELTERASLIGTLVHLWPYIWPGDRMDLKMRVVWSVVLLLVAKVATLAVPFTFKWATDALSGKGTAPIEPSNWMIWVIASPLIMTASYGSLRIVMAVLTQWRDGIFAHGEKVRNDAGYHATVIEYRVCKRTHQAERSPAKDQTNAALGESLAERLGAFDVAGI